MTTITPNEEFIQKNYTKTLELIEKVSGTESPLYKMIDGLAERYALCPASSQQSYYSAFPGGLCYHNLNVARWMNKFAELMMPKEFSSDSILKVAILSEIGKLGDAQSDLYIPTKEDWKKRNGQYYDINNDLRYMKINQRSLYFASLHNVPLTENEYLAILLADPSEESNRAYKYKEPELALILQFANQWAQKLEKSYTVNWP